MLAESICWKEIIIFSERGSKKDSFVLRTSIESILSWKIFEKMPNFE